MTWEEIERQAQRLDVTPEKLAAELAELAVSMPELNQALVESAESWLQWHQSAPWRDED